MGGVSPVLYRPVVPARLVKISADAQFSASAQIFTISCEKSKILSRLLSVLSLHRKFIHDHCCCPNSATILTDSQMEAVLDFGRGCQDLTIIQLGCGEGGGGGNEAWASCLCYHIWMGEGEIGGGLATVYTPHICNPSFSLLHSAVESAVEPLQCRGLFRYKKKGLHEAAHTHAHTMPRAERQRRHFIIAEG
jgi:hypothetical protein